MSTLAYIWLIDANGSPIVIMKNIIEKVVTIPMLMA